MQLDMPGARQRRLRRDVGTVDRGIVELQGDSPRHTRQSRHAAARLAPVRDHRRLAGTGDGGRRGKFRDQQFRVIDLRHDQDFAELCRDRRLRRGLSGGLRNQRHADAVAANFKTERIAGHRAPGAIIDAAGPCLLGAPGIRCFIDLRGGIEPERAPRGSGDQKQDRHEEKAPKRAPARREGHVGHGATFDQ